MGSTQGEPSQVTFSSVSPSQSSSLLLQVSEVGVISPWQVLQVLPVRQVRVPDLQSPMPLVLVSPV